METKEVIDRILQRVAELPDELRTILEEEVGLRSSLEAANIDYPESVSDWLFFSQLQAATEMIVDAPTVERFLEWRRTGRPEDAWS